MATIINKQMTLIDILKSGLESEIKSSVTNKIVDDMVDEFRAKALDVVSAHVNAITVDRIEGIKDLINLRDELHIFINGVKHG